MPGSGRQGMLVTNSPSRHERSTRRMVFRQSRRAVADFCCSSNGGSNGLVPDRPFVSFAGSILGTDCDADCPTVDTAGCPASFRSLFRGNGGRSGDGRSDGHLLSSEHLGVRSHRFHRRIGVRRAARRSKCVPIRKHHARDRVASFPIHQRSASRVSPILRSIHRACHRPCACRPLAEIGAGRYDEGTSRSGQFKMKCGQRPCQSFTNWSCASLRPARNPQLADPIG